MWPNPHLLKKSFMKASFFVECKNLQEVNATCKFIWNVCCGFIYGVSFYQGKLGLANLMKSYLRYPLFRMSPIRIFVCCMFIKTMGILHGFHFADAISPNVSRILWKSSSNFFFLVFLSRLSKKFYTMLKPTK